MESLPCEKFELIGGKNKQNKNLQWLGNECVSGLNYDKVCPVVSSYRLCVTVLHTDLKLDTVT